jgi:hypothetical protein
MIIYRSLKDGILTQMLLANPSFDAGGGGCNRKWDSTKKNLTIVILGARQVGAALVYFNRSELEQDRTGHGFAAAK